MKCLTLQGRSCSRDSSVCIVVTGAAGGTGQPAGRIDMGSIPLALSPRNKN